MWRILCLIVFALAAQISRAQEALPEGVVEPRNISVSFLAESQSDLIQWSQIEERLGAKYVRVHFSDINDVGNSSYHIILRDRNSRPAQTFDAATFRARKSFWTPLIEGDYVKIEVVASEKPAGLSFKLADIAYQQNMGAPFSITFPDEREPVVKYQNFPKLADRIHAVAKLTFITGKATAACTGFLIDDDRMLTNEHCINQAETCGTMIAIFDYEISQTGSVSFGNQFPCEKYIDSSYELDVALIRISGKPGMLHGHLSLNAREVVKDEQA